MRLYREWLARGQGLAFPDYAAMWAWSVTDLSAFWGSIWAYADLQSPTPFTSVVSGAMPGAVWFPGAQVNYARQVFRHAEAAEAAGQPAIIAEDEAGRVVELGWRELQRRSASLALELRRAGIGRGDRVAAYLPNAPEAVISLLACASLGAIWTLCSPDMGTPAVLDRFRQVAPKALIAVDGVLYAGKRLDRSAVVEQLRSALPSLVAVVVVQTDHADAPAAGATDFEAATSRDDAEVQGFEPEWLPFDHPLWILYSSGTTGLPKAIVHGHGGVMVAACAGALHFDIGASYSSNTPGERFHWYSATGWVMWNVQVGGLLGGTTICLFDGAPSGAKTRSDWRTLWAFAGRHQVTWFGAGAAFFSGCRKADLSFGEIEDLGAIRALGSTGSPLPADVQLWGGAAFRDAGFAEPWWCNISGGTELAAAFLAGHRELPPTPGRLQCRQLGAAVEAWDEAGRAVIGEVGELVCRQPFPSMPLYFWGDQDGSRYASSYFSEWPGVWRHGDWLEVHADGSCTISGRSDATINRHGLRMGTAELYAAVEGVPGVADSLVIDVEDAAGDSKLLMFVAPQQGRALDPDLEAAMSAAIRVALSPRFVPDAFIWAPAIPRTLSGKKQELPIKRLYQGWPVAKVINLAGVDDPDTVGWYVTQARDWVSNIQRGTSDVAP
jgi:acetoacetyl-CoA synthetase